MSRGPCRPPVPGVAALSKNLPASVRQRLTDKAKETDRPFQEVLQYFAMERFLYRLARSRHAHRFVLKGALLFTAWGGPSSRTTKDIDFLARMDNDVEAVVAVIREVCTQEVEPDGLAFDAGSGEGEAIKEDADYSGVRVKFLVTLQNARVSMQIDMGFGDVVTPAATLTEYPALLGFPAPQLLGYPRETVVAEKFEAMTKLGLLNSRMKDFYDLWVLRRQFDFDGGTLATAIRRTFAHRKTAVVARPTALTAAFGEDAAKQTQWQGFLRKTRLDDVPPSLQSVIDELAPFLVPVAAAVETRSAFEWFWTAPGPWRTNRSADS
ncbi:MAG: nucleotidyl transferase AbiEii/AbiGii toxin family protein [Gemmataceae bacterium]|nr:nucleotidyl transferase AbiEii/AbiGii toxin family protein [Gemmataceae bacterium]